METLTWLIRQIQTLDIGQVDSFLITTKPTQVFVGFCLVSNQDLSSELSSLIQSWCNQARWMLGWELLRGRRLFVSTMIMWILVFVYLSEPWAANSFPNMPHSFQSAVGSSTPATWWRVQAEAKYENGNISHTAGSFDSFRSHGCHAFYVVGWNSCSSYWLEAVWRWTVTSVSVSWLWISKWPAEWVFIWLSTACHALSQGEEKASLEHSRESNWQLYFPIKKQLFADGFSKGLVFHRTATDMTECRRRCEEVRMI